MLFLIGLAGRGKVQSKKKGHQSIAPLISVESQQSYRFASFPIGNPDCAPALIATAA